MSEAPKTERRTTRTTDGVEVRGSAFWIEIAVYAALITGYLLLVLKTLDVPLARMFARHRVEYAFVALLLILAQGIVLELVTKVLVGFLGGRFGRRRR